MLSIIKNDLELLSGAYLAAAENNQMYIRAISTTLARKNFDHWITVLITGAIKSLESIDLNQEKIHTAQLSDLIWHIGWHRQKPIYSRLHTGLVILRGNPSEICRLQDIRSKGDILAAMLTITGQVICRQNGNLSELCSNAANVAAAALESSSHLSEKEKHAKRQLAINVMKMQRASRASGGARFWRGVRGFLKFVFAVVDIFT